MEQQRLAGIAITVAGLVGYIAGIFVAYPGRSFSITVVMVGIAIAAISREQPMEAAT